MTRDAWKIWACSACGRQADEMDGGWCHDHDPPAEFDEVAVVPAERRCACGKTRGILWNGTKWVCARCAAREKRGVGQ